MTWNDTDLEKLALRLDGGCLTLTVEQRNIALATFRELAGGDPAEAGRIAVRAGAPLSRVRAALRSWPGVAMNSAGNVKAFWGLSLTETPFKILIDGRMLYTWCAWDSLFMGGLIGESTRIRSVCAATNVPVTIDVGPAGLENVSPSGVHVSFPQSMGAGNNVDPGCDPICSHVKFFGSRDAWAQWSSSYSVPVLALTARDAWRLGRIGIRLRYGSDVPLK